MIEDAQRCGLSRTVLDLILINRVGQVKEKDKPSSLQYSVKVPVSLYVKDNSDNDEIIKGEADWVIGYGADKACIGSIFVVIDTEPLQNTLIAMNQLLVCMAAAQNARRSLVDVHGMVSDGENYEFACLDKNKILRTSAPYQWFVDQARIITYIDNILMAALESRPHPSPTKFCVYIRGERKDSKKQ